jgi:hypothetical protein
LVIEASTVCMSVTATAPATGPKKKPMPPRYVASSTSPEVSDESDSAVTIS